jgi:carbon storage regulator CsrA
MLVVTRRPNEKIIFPNLGISIQILRINGNTAKVGVDAPPEIKILREEICPISSPETLAKRDHALANALSKVTLGIHLARKQWEAGFQQEAYATLETTLSALESLEKSSSTSKPALKPLRCKALIVEDDANQRELLAGLLGMNGCECATAADGIDAMTYLETADRPDVVLLDMAMPRCGGAETLRQIRADERYLGVKVYSLSSTSPQELNVPDGPGGFDGWFPKPLNPRRLWDTIQDVLRSPALAN